MERFEAGADSVFVVGGEAAPRLPWGASPLAASEEHIGGVMLQRRRSDGITDEKGFCVKALVQRAVANFERERKLESSGGNLEQLLAQKKKQEALFEKDSGTLGAHFDRESLAEPLRRLFV